jgi:putative addiction module component (TIGR02574 family)
VDTADLDRRTGYARTMTKNELVDEALKLPRQERLGLASELLRSLGEDLSDAEWEASWGAELNSRLASMHAGEPGVPFAQVLERLERAGARKAS